MKTNRYAAQGCLALDSKAWGGEFMIVASDPAKPFTIEGTTAVVTITGPLTQHPVFIWDSYDAIKERVTAAFASEAKCVALRIDSPGGDAAGCFELARELRQLARASGKKLGAFTDAMAASAAYAIACAADRVVVTSTGIVGSIGVIEMMCDETARDRAMGLNVIAVTSGTRKTDKNPHVPITKDAVAEVQSKVDQMAGLFFDLVGEMRGLGPEKVRAIEAATQFGAAAVRSGLADEVLTWTGFLSSLEATQGGTAAAQVETKAMGKYLDEAKVALRRAADDSDDEDEKKVAQKALKAFDDEKKDDEGNDEKKDAKAKAEEDEKKKKDEEEAKAKAKAEEDEKEKSKAKAKAAADPAFDLAAHVQQLEAERAASREALAREKLLAKRPDFSGAILATLQTMPLDRLEEAVEKWPKIIGTVKPAAGALALGTRSKGQAGDPDNTDSLPPTEADYIDRKMGLKVYSGSIKSDERSLELGHLSPEQVDKRLKEFETQKGAA